MIGTRKVPERKVIIPKRPDNYLELEAKKDAEAKPKADLHQRKGYKKGTGKYGGKSELELLWDTTEEEDQEEAKEGEEKEDDEDEVEGEKEIQSDT